MRKFASAMKLLGLLLSFIFSSYGFAQTSTISGTIVSDDDGGPLLGVTVTNKTNNKKYK